MTIDCKATLDYCLKFTEIYKSETDKNLREAKCLKFQTPNILTDIQDGDLIIGGMAHKPLGFSPQYGAMSIDACCHTYFFGDKAIADLLEKIRGEVNGEYAERIEEMRSFWRNENTDAKIDARYMDRYGRKRCSGGKQGYWAVGRISGVSVDLNALVDLGLGGLKEKINQYRLVNGDSTFYSALDMSIDVIGDACLSYARRAKDVVSEEVFRHIATSKPKTFRQGLQLVWIYAVCSDLMNYGRLDDCLGDLYTNDIENGVIAEEDATALLTSFYRNIARVGKIHDGRIVIGGVGRRNPESADKLALIMIETAKSYQDILPQLTLRYYSGMNERLMDATLDNIAAGAVYPIVYSDDAIIPGIEKMYRIDNELAQNWVPFGCGEYVLQGYGVSTPNSGILMPRVLDILLHKGYNSFTGEKEHDNMPDPSRYVGFNELYEAYMSLIRGICDEMAYHEQLNYDLAGEEAGYMHISLLTHSCIEQNRGVFSGGCAYLAPANEVFGLITAADSLNAIKFCVYDARLFGIGKLIEMLDANFEGYERERRALTDVPKYGNDDDVADEIAVRLFNDVADATEMAGRQTTLRGYHMVCVNNSGSAEYGRVIAATPDGRLRSEPFSNGNSPALGADKNGLTAVLNSMSKFDPHRHAGVVHNIRLNKDMLKNNIAKIKALLEAFYENNGTQTNLSSIGKEDLEQAMLHPEKYHNLLVRVGGFSARFVELDPIVQHEILLRTTYEG
ncbi:glycyl radical enzyme [Clostridia bacterium]|nr:glycyl radical enzyme [Clostridia bacterium]